MKRLTLLALALFFTVGCASHRPTGKISRGVRTTAYTHTEPGGIHDACGGRLTCNGPVHSAAADWSRYPVGTKFKIMETGEVCQIDDYGSALVGTDTIDLYKDSRRKMNNWGVRQVKIKILEWGSNRRSLEILSPRTHNRHVARMVAALRGKTQGLPSAFRRNEG